MCWAPEKYFSFFSWTVGLKQKNPKIHFFCEINFYSPKQLIRNNIFLAFCEGSHCFGKFFIIIFWFCLEEIRKWARNLVSISFSTDKLKKNEMFLVWFASFNTWFRKRNRIDRIQCICLVGWLSWYGTFPSPLVHPFHVLTYPWVPLYMHNITPADQKR